MHYEKIFLRLHPINIVWRQQLHILVRQMNKFLPHPVSGCTRVNISHMGTALLYR